MGVVGSERDAAVEARRRVEREAALRGGRLSLAGLGLEALPPELLELTDLRELDLSENRLGELPLQFGLLVGLERLSLRGNRLVGLPGTFTALTRLRHLDLAGNQFAEIPRRLGRLDLETLELGDTSGLLHPPARVAAEGTRAVLAYLRLRDGSADDEGVPAAVAAPSIPPDETHGPASPHGRDGSADRATAVPLAGAGAAMSVLQKWMRGPARAHRRGLTIGVSVTAVLAAAGAALAALQVGDSAPPSTAILGGVSAGPQFPTTPGRPSAQHSTGSGAAVSAPAEHTTGAGGPSATTTSGVAGMPVAAGMPATAPAGFTATATLPTTIATAVTGSITSATSGTDALCADSASGANGRGSKSGLINVVICDSSQATAWTFQPVSGTLQTIGLCMAVNADAAVLTTCDGGPAQVFVPRLGGELYNPASGLCVTDLMGNKDQHTAVPLETCGGAGQDWSLPF